MKERFVSEHANVTRSCLPERQSAPVAVVNKLPLGEISCRLWLTGFFRTMKLLSTVRGQCNVP